MAYHVPFAHRHQNPGNQPPVYIGFDEPRVQRCYYAASVRHRPFNWSGFTGLMLALCSPLTGFLLAPFALLFSLNGMRRAPRGMAFVATVLSLGGTAILATCILAVVGGHHEQQMAIHRARHAQQLQEQRSETAATLEAAATQLKEFHNDHGTLPGGLDGNMLTIQFTDAWGGQLRYEPGKEQATVRSAGEDGKFETSDDMLTTVAGIPRIGLSSESL